MAYKDILVYADADDHAASYLDVATSLASAHGAHLVALHVLPPPVVPADITTAVPVEFIEWQEEYAKQQAEKARQQVSAAQQRSGVNIEWRAVDGVVLSTVLLHSHYADLVVLSQSESGSVGALPETVVMGSGRPALIVPSRGRFPTVGKRVLVAWNRTREATRALHDSLPLLERATSVTIMEVNPEGGRHRHIAGADIAAHLARYGVKVDVASTTAPDIDVGDAILSRVADLGVDCLVMGAYSHSRLREFAFGGATRHVLESMTVPVLMSH